MSESYRILDGKVEAITINNEPVNTQAFNGGHFGTYYFLLDDGRVAKFYDSYWNETLILYKNMK